ncbi:MAG: hypothetical protein JW999_02670 [Methanotrichaceae archaeon]|nr:hypothetical protein [Methanotrichaceae archaeon]
MDFKDCIKFTSDNPVSFIATMDGELPRVRAFLMWFAHESGFYCHAGSDLMAENMRDAEILRIKF